MSSAAEEHNEDGFSQDTIQAECKAARRRKESRWIGL